MIQSIEKFVNISGLEPEFVNKLSGRLLQYCLHLTENRWSAEDLAQETWMKALHTLKTKSHSNPQAFLFQIAKNSWIDQCRRQRLLRNYLELEKNKSISTCELGFEYLETIFHALIKHLSPLQRAVFLLKDVYEYSIIETANALNITQGAVKAALHRARKSLGGARRDLEANDLTIPEDSGYHSLLRNLAAAFQKGNVASVIELLIQNEMEPNVAYVIAYNHILTSRDTTAKDNLQGIRLSAAA